MKKYIIKCKLSNNYKGYLTFTLCNGDKFLVSKNVFRDIFIKNQKVQKDYNYNEFRIYNNIYVTYIYKNGNAIAWPIESILKDNESKIKLYEKEN